MEEAPVLVERRAGYRVITLNRPRQLNAFNEAMHQELKRALAEAEEDTDCRALLLTGAGRAFCAGQDLRERMTPDGKTMVLGDALDTHYNPLVPRGLALPAEPLPADKAEAWGLIWKTLDDLELMAQAHQLCVHFTAAPTVALALIKRALDEAWANDLDTQLDLERESQREASLSPDYAEGMRAFLQKRSPAFTGRRVP